MNNRIRDPATAPGFFCIEHTLGENSCRFDIDLNRRRGYLRPVSDDDRRHRTRTQSADEVSRKQSGQVVFKQKRSLARNPKARQAPTMENQGQRNQGQPCVSFGFNARSPFREYADRLGDGTAIEVGTLAKIPARRHSTLSVLPHMRRHGTNDTVDGL